MAQIGGVDASVGLSYRLPPEALESPESFLDVATDVPSSSPAIAISLRRAGIADHHLTFDTRSFADADSVLRFSGMVAASASVSANRRGVHMSRFVESLAPSTQLWDSPDDYVRTVVADIARRQASECAYVSVEATATVARRTPVTDRVSPDTFRIMASAQFVDGKIESRFALTATVITACPCTQAYSWYSSVIDLARTLDLETATVVGERILGYTHSQRATVTVEVDGGPEGISATSCYEAICDGAHVVHDLLKRPDEHYLVRKAHARPQFTEDVVRDVALSLARVVGSTERSNRVVVSSEALESIHSHIVESQLEAELSELMTLIAP